MNKMFTYLLKAIVIYVLLLLLRWMLKSETELLSDIVLLILAVTIPLPVSNCVSYLMNKVRRVKKRIRNKNKKNGL